MIEQRVTLRYGAQQIPAIVQAVQGDTGRDVIFELADYEIPAGATANYYIDKPDGNAVYNSAEVISSTEIFAHLTEQALAEPGRNNGQVRILSDGEVITSFDFVLEVEAFRGILRLQSDTEVNIFDQAIEDAVNTATEEAVAEIQAQTPVVTGMQNSIAPSYSSSSTYAVGDYVMYNAQLYRCITAITTAEAWTAAHWTQVPLANDVNGLKSALNNQYALLVSAMMYEIVFESVDTTNGGLYLKIPGTWWIRGRAGNPSAISYDSISLQKSTSPLGVSDCLFIPHESALVLNLSNNSLEIVSFDSITRLTGANLLSLFSVSRCNTKIANDRVGRDGVVGGLGKNLYDAYQDYYCDNNTVFFVNSDNAPYFEPTEYDLYLKLDGVWQFRGLVYRNIEYADVLTDLGSSYVKTSPLGVDNCIYIPTGHSLYWSKQLQKVVVMNYNTNMLYNNLPLILLGMDGKLGRMSVTGGVAKYLYDMWERNQIAKDYSDQITWVNGTLDQNGIDRETTYSFFYKRIVSDFYYVGKNTVVYIDSSSYNYICYFYDNQKVFLNNSVSGWKGKATKTIIPSDCYIRIVIRRSDDSDISESDIASVSSHVHLMYYGSSADSLCQLYNAVPSYYEAQLTDKIETIRHNMNDCGQSGDTFIFITDLHWDPYDLRQNRNARRSPSLIKRIVKETGIKKIITGGDYFTGNDDADFEFEQMRNIFNSLNIKNTFLYPIMGNHDWNEYNTPVGQWDDSTAYACIMKQCENYVEMGDYLCYHFDIKACKTRYIILNSGGEYESLPSAQITWFENVLNNTPSGYKVIVMMHIWFEPINGVWSPTTLEPSNQGSAISAICDAYNSQHNDSKVIILIGGHVHFDFDSSTQGGIPIVLSDTDAYLSASQYSGIATVGTVNESCFDVVTVDYKNSIAKFVRIGRGNDRTISL